MISPPPPTGRRAGFEENEYLYEHRHARALRGHGRVSGRVPVSLHAAVVFHRTGSARDRQRGRAGQRHRRARGAGHCLGQGVSVPVRGRRQAGRTRRRDRHRRRLQGRARQRQPRARAQKGDRLRLEPAVTRGQCLGCIRA